MSRLFDDASSQYLEHGAAVLTGVPITMACWFYSDTITVSQDLMSIGDTSVENQYFVLRARGASAGDPIVADTTSSAASDDCSTTTGYSTNTWHHACAVYAAINDRRVFLDGGSKATNATSITPAGLAQTRIGTVAKLTGAFFMSGRIAEAAIWNAAFDDSEVALLSKGLSPLLMRHQPLPAYWPLFGNDSPELDRWKNKFDVTLINGPTKAEHPRIYYPVGAL